MSHQSDFNKTLKNIKKLNENRNLLYWYRELFKAHLGEGDTSKKKILEIGSGTSPIKLYYSSVITSDVMPLKCVDISFDCHYIHNIEVINNVSLDMILMTNVMHHLKSPITFLKNATVKLKRGGTIVLTEPFFSLISTLIYKYIHHEPVDLSIDEPKLGDIKGPLSSANSALPFMIFYSKKKWLNTIKRYYTVEPYGYFSFISYFITGGISKKIPIPQHLYKLIFKFDMFLSKCFPTIFASFFTVKLIKK